MSLTVYKSSAGSGKTFTLVSEYLRLILTKPFSYRQILAITFTNKAANEMKDRIMAALEQLSDPNLNGSDAHRNYLKQLVKTTGLDEATIHQRAADLVTQILHNYSDLSVSTIDSFTQRVIRSFAHDLGLPQGYEVELDTNSLLQRAVDRLINRIGRDSSITRMLLDFSQLKIEDENHWRIERDLCSIAKDLFIESGMQLNHQNSGITQVECSKVMAGINRWINDFTGFMSALGNKALQLIEGEQLGFEHFYQGNKGLANFFKKLTSDKVIETMPLNSNVKATLHEGKWYAMKASPSIKQQIDSIRPQLESIAADAINRLEKDLGTYILYKLLRKQLTPTAVLSNIQMELETICTEERLLPISMFNKIVASVTHSEPVPFIFLRIGERYRHYMVDEFQDTSVLQWNNLIPLIDDSLSQNNFNLIVGDAKQAIYRWRNGEVEQFTKLPKLHDYNLPLATERERNLSNHYQLRPLNTNYRSHQIIVDFNNRLFDYLKDQLGGITQQVYKDARQESLSSKPGGYVEVEFHKESNGEFIDWHQNRIKEVILDLLNDGFDLSDVAILCRKNDEASSIAAFLLNNGIDVISAESLQIATSPRVRLVSALMRIIETSDDQMAFTEAVFVLFESRLLSEQPDLQLFNSLMITKLTEGKKTRIYEPTHFERWLNSLDVKFSLAELRTLPLYECAETLIRILGFNIADDIFMQFFLEALHDGVTRKRLQPGGFKKWWEEKGATQSVAIAEGSPAVQVMTIHKAKGLQFNVVIYPIANRQWRSNISHTWVSTGDPLLAPFTALRLPIESLSQTCFEYLKHHEIEKTVLDNVNLVYVALTRAVERLYVLSGKPSNGRQEMKQTTDLLLGFLNHERPEWNYNNSPFTFGVAESKPVGNKASPAQPVKTTLPCFPGWRSRMKIGRPGSIHSVSENDHARLQGLFIHAVLSKMQQPDQLDRVVKHLLAKEVYSMLDPNETIGKLRLIVAHPLIQRMFEEAGEQVSEPTIIKPEGGQYRPDRVVISGANVTVYEFKTGRHEPEHSKQLQHYIELLRNMEYISVKGKLLYIGDTVQCVDVD